MFTNNKRKITLGIAIQTLALIGLLNQGHSNNSVVQAAESLKPQEAVLEEGDYVNYNELSISATHRALQRGGRGGRSRGDNDGGRSGSNDDGGYESSQSDEDAWGYADSTEETNDMEDYDDWHGGTHDEADEDDWNGDWNDWFDDEGENSKEADATIDVGAGWDKVKGWFGFGDHSTDKKVNLNLSWAGVEDVEFWEWFWQWYVKLDDNWTFEHEMGEVADLDFTYEWLKEHTAIGLNTTIDELIIDEDSKGWSQKQWDEFWYNFNNELPQEYQKQAGEDRFCGDSMFENLVGKCQPCPVGCDSCHTLDQCYSCSDNFQLVYGSDFGFCFPKCFHGHYRQTFFDSQTKFLSQFDNFQVHSTTNLVFPPTDMMKTCLDCSNNCLGCFKDPSQPDESAPFCYECDHGFVIDKNTDQCVIDPDWMQTRSTIRVKSMEHKMQKCDNTKLHVYPDEGFDGSKLTNVTWDISYKTVVDGAQAVESQQDVQDTIQKLKDYFTDKETIIIPSNLTGLFINDVELTVTANSYNWNFTEQVSDSETLIIYSDPFTQLAGFKNSYYVTSDATVAFDFYIRHPRCINDDDQIPVDAASNPDIQCRLYDQQNLELAQLSDCTVDSQYLQSGNTYFVEIHYKTNDNQHFQRDMVKIAVQSEKSFCRFTDGKKILISADSNHNIDPLIKVNNEDDMDYIWECTMFDIEDGEQGYCEGNPKMLNTDTRRFTVSSDAWLPGKRYFFNLNIQDYNETIATCQQEIMTAFADQTVVPLQLLGSQSSFGVIDPEQDQNFECLPLESVGSSTQLNYNITIEQLNSKKNRPYTITKDAEGVTFYQNGVLLEKDYLRPFYFYDIKCLISDSSNQTVGYVFTELSSEKITDPLEFRVLPKNGIAFQTEFNLLLKKPKDEALSCKFGYRNDFGEVELQDDSAVGGIYSATSQSIQTKLPSVNDSYEITTFAQCIDKLGKTRTLTYRVDLAADDVFIDEEQEEIMIQTFYQEISAFEELSATYSSTADIVSVQLQLDALQQRNITTDSDMKQKAVRVISDSIAALDEYKQSDVQQLSVVMRDFSEQMISEEQLMGDLQKETAIAVAKAMVNLAKGGPTQRDNKVEIITQDDFTNIGAVIDNIIQVNRHIIQDNELVQETFNLINEFDQSTVNRFAGNVQEGIDSSYEFDNLNMVLAKMKSQNFYQQGMISFGVDEPIGRRRMLESEIPDVDGDLNDINSEERPQLRFELHYDESLFGNYDSVIISASVVDQPDQFNELSTDFQETKFVSNIFQVSAKGSDQFHAINDQFSIEEIKVQNLQTPINFQVPLSSGALSDGADYVCTYFDEDIQSWQKLECEPSYKKDVSSGFASCCTTHLTTFAVQELETLSIASMNSASGWLIQMNIIFLIFFIIAVVLEKKKMCIYEPTNKERQSAYKEDKKLKRQQGPTNEQIQNSNEKQVDKNNGNDEEVRPSAIPMVSQQDISKEVDDNVVDFFNGQGKQNQADNVAENGIQLKDIELQDVSKQTPSKKTANSSGNPEQETGSKRSSDLVSIDLVSSSASLDSEVVSGQYVKDPSGFILLCNALRFYNRILCIFFSHDTRQNRPSRALNSATQIFIMGAFISVISTQGNIQGANSILAPLLTAFFLMRLVQPVLNFLLFRSAKDAENKTKRFVALGSLALIFVCSQIITGLSVQNLPAQENNNVYQFLMYGTAIELLLWDTILMPIILGVIAYRCNKQCITGFFTALKV